MLPEKAELKMVTVEAPAPDDRVSSGVDVIDIALYFGSEQTAHASRIEYRQFKHSWVQAHRPFTASALSPTLAKFAERYRDLVSDFGAGDVAKRFRFIFETNRAVDPDVKVAIADIAAGIQSKRSAFLRRKIGLEDSDLRAFAALVRLHDAEEDFLAQQRRLREDLSLYLPGPDRDAPVVLKDLIARKATTEFEANPIIRRHDVLDVLGTRPDQLFPAPNLIELPDAPVPRTQLGELCDAIANRTEPTIISADGGVGKSVITSQLNQSLPEGSATFVYDCFANGSYRTPSQYRHAAAVGLVQLANEMAAADLCELLIPSDRANPQAYAKAFMARVGQASAAIASRGTGALLCIVVDAADNAEEAAAEASDGPSFPRGLLRELWPDNVRLVLTARPYRIDLLDPPEASLPPLTLQPFDIQETAANLRGRFPNVSDPEVAEFHELTSHNPRVQAAALSSGTEFGQIMSSLGDKPRTVAHAIEALLEQAVRRTKDAWPQVRRAQIDAICTALATLRPFVPLQVVAEAAGVSVDLVRSLAHDLQHPLIVRADAVQFRDEPTESWFRKRFKPSRAQLADYAASLQPLASSSAYVAAMLPQLLLEAGELGQLIELALAGRALPENSPIARRDVELQRLQFAIKAALRAGRHTDAAKLAVKAGGEAAAGTRQQRLLSGNGDLAAQFLSGEALLEQVARRQIVGGEWVGSEHAYEAALLSGKAELQGQASAKLRASYDWLRHWSRTKKVDQKNRQVTDRDIAELGWAELNLHGPRACTAQLRSWRPRTVSFLTGRMIARRLIDAGRFAEVDELASAARNDVGLIAAITLELAAVGRSPPRSSLVRVLKLAANPALRWPTEDQRFGQFNVNLSAATAIVTAAASLRLLSRRTLARILSGFLPAAPPASLYSERASYDDVRAIHLEAYVLRAALRSRRFELDDLLPKKVRKANSQHESDLRRFREEVGAVLPWHRLASDVALGRVPQTALPDRLADARAEMGRALAQSYREDSKCSGEIAALWTRILIRSGVPGECWTDFETWLGALGKPFGTRRLTEIARRAARTQGWESRAGTLAQRVFSMADAQREDAQDRVETLVGLTRAMLTSHPREAAFYFDQAVEVASRLGDEVASRWEALMDLAKASAEDGRDDPELAYRFARAAELIDQYMYDNFDWRGTVEGLCALSPSSVLPVVSRWTDRKVGVPRALIAMAVSALREAGQIDGRDALALLPLRADWDPVNLIRDALAETDDRSEQHSQFRWFMRYRRFTSPADGDWGTIAELARGIEFADPLLTARAAHASKAETAEKRTGRRKSNPSKRPRIRWQSIFAGLDLTQSVDLKRAIDRYRRRKSGFYFDAFLAEAIQRVPGAREENFLKALEQAHDIGFWDLRTLLETLPPAWTNRSNVQRTLARLVRETYRHNFSYIHLRPWHQPIPIQMASDAAKVRPCDLYREAVDGVAETTAHLDAADLFRLVSLISQLQAPSEACDVLATGLDLLEPALEDSDGDGPWTASLTPRAKAAKSLSGYLLAALASPFATRRWQAAHVVRGLCVLRRTAVLDGLVELMKTRSGGVFTDPRLRFYDLHALQWLLIAFARASKEAPASLAPYVEFLNDEMKCTTHVLVRGFAAEALLGLNAAGTCRLGDDVRHRLEAINHSPFKPKRSRRDRPSSTHKRGRQRKSDFRFDFDFDQYWASPLASPFGLTDRQVMTMTQNVIRNDWRLSDTGHWEEDERAKRKYFADDWRSDRGSIPRSDDLSSYLSYHALMVVAGKLVDHRPQRFERHQVDGQWGTFAYWLKGQALTRSDGCWLADRRDPTPEDCGDGERLQTDWLEPDALQRAGTICVNGSWNRYSTSHHQRVRISSALVTSDKAEALGAALISAREPMNYRVPDFEDDLEIDEPEFAFKGWIQDIGNERALDERDPWAAEVQTRLATPERTLADRLGWISDSMGRQWTGEDGEILVQSYVWSEADPDRYRNSGREEHDAEGQRLLLSKKGLEALLRQTGQSLLIDQEVKNAKIRYSYDWDESEKDEERIRQITLIGSERAQIVFRARSATRRKARRRARARR